MIVVDASVMVAALTGCDAAGEWAGEQLRSDDLTAPAHASFEVGNVLRRLELSGRLQAGTARMALDDLISSPIALVELDASAERAWQLRHDCTSYDGVHRALAEVLDARFVRLDRRLEGVPETTARIPTRGV